MDVPWGLVMELVILILVVSFIWNVMKGILRITMIIFVVILGIWGFYYVTADDFSSNKLFNDLGKAVQSVEEMTPTIMEVAGETVRVIQDAGSRISFSEKGLTFAGKDNGLKGTLGLNDSGIVLYMEAPISDDSAMHTAVKIASAFSGDATVGNAIRKLRSQDKNQRVEWGNGHMEVKDGKFILVRKKRLSV